MSNNPFESNAWLQIVPIKKPIEAAWLLEPKRSDWPNQLPPTELVVKYEDGTGQLYWYDYNNGGWQATVGDDTPFAGSTVERRINQLWFTTERIL